jgi:hypothetical protein
MYNVLFFFQQIKLAYSQLAEIKRKKTVGVKYNSATIFTLMWLGYLIGSLLVYASDPKYDMLHDFS